MEAIRLTNMDNEQVWINLNNVVSFNKCGKRTLIKYLNGATVEVKESLPIVQYLLDHYVYEVDADIIDINAIN